MRRNRRQAPTSTGERARERKNRTAEVGRARDRAAVVGVAVDGSEERPRRPSAPPHGGGATVACRRRGAVAGRPDSRTGSFSRSAGDLTSDPKASSVTTFGDQNRRSRFACFLFGNFLSSFFHGSLRTKKLWGAPRMPRSPGEGQNGIAASVYRGGPPPSLERSSHPAEFHQRGEAAKSDAQR